jgi:hypothetical protein
MRLHIVLRNRPFVPGRLKPAPSTLAGQSDKPQKSRGSVPPPQPQSTVRDATVDRLPVPPTERRGDARSPRRAGGLHEFAAGRSCPRMMARSRPLWPAGHLPHIVGENVRERRPYLHPDREERRWRQTLSCQQNQPLCSTTSRGSRLRGGKKTRHTTGRTTAGCVCISAAAQSS